MASRFPPYFKRDVATVSRRSNATFEGLASDFRITVNSLRRWIRQADVADGRAAGPSNGGPDDVVALRCRS